MTDIFFGSLIDKTHSKMGKARPWMLYGYIGCAITLVAIFAIPTNLGQFAQYAWFLIAYTLLNAVFYTANNIAYSALTALVTKNSAEQVEMGSWRFMFAFATSLLIPVHYAGCCHGIGRWCCRLAHRCNHLRHHRSACQHPLRFLREGTAGRRIGGYHRRGKSSRTKTPNLVQAVALPAGNKYALMICVTRFAADLRCHDHGHYYTTYILGRQNLFGVFSWAINIL